MALDAPDFPESFADVLGRLSTSLIKLRELRLQVSAEPALRVESPQALIAWVQEIRRGGQALSSCGRTALALVVEGCAAAGERLQAVPALHGQDSLEVIERALAAVLERAEHPLTDAVQQAVELFPLHRAVQHLAGADRVHPADLWPGEPAWQELAADPFTAARPVDAAAREALESALLALMRQPRAEDFQRMSELCAALGEGAMPPQASVWKLASAVYEAQAEGRLASDVYLKRLGPRLLAMTRAAAAPDAVLGQSLLDPPSPAPGPGPMSEPLRLLAHELLFFCHRALSAGSGDTAPPGPRLARFAAAYGRAPVPETDAAAEPPHAPAEDLGPAADTPAPVASPRPEAQRSLADAVPGLPSAADLDFSSWTMAANADVAAVPDDEVKVIGPLRLEIPRFNAFLNDADEASRRLGTVLAEWALEPDQPVPSQAQTLAQSLARSAAEVGHQALADLCDATALALQAISPPATLVSANDGAPLGSRPSVDAAERLIGAAEEIRRVLHQFAAGFLTEPAPRTLERLAEISHVAPQPLGPNDLRYLQEVARAQDSVTQALDRLAACRPSALAAAQDPAQADHVFDAAWAEAVGGVKASQQLLESLLKRGGPPSA